MTDPDLKAYIEATKSWRVGDHEKLLSLKKDFGKRVKHVKKRQLEEFALTWRLPFNPLYLKLDGADIAHTDRKLFDKIKNILRKRGEGERCWACRRKQQTQLKRFAAHELWAWDDDRGVRRLTAIHFLCEDCHYLTHHAYWLFECIPSERDIQLIRLFCKVNHCTYIEAFAHVKSAMKLCDLRQYERWKVDLSPISGLIAEARKLNRTEPEQRSDLKSIMRAGK